mmetsp:Transcript_3907/g.6880  ORF Transcript_3907/g.6880 Transcript_3907/m.6880 type:complete len:335 (+) Transcript_3907:61-1065(+)
MGADRLMPWVEKYRPRQLSDVAAQKQVVSALNSSLETGQVPHLLFYGPPGTGKTSTCVAMAKELYGEHYADRVLELNASDERGISVVREKVKGFASTAVASVSSGGKQLPPFKLIILDESDSMTGDAQSALRRTMELYTRVTRFCLICNYVSRIIEPLASRCAKFRFEPLPEEEFVAKIKYICKEERVELIGDALETLIEVSRGDLRRGITLLQTTSQFANGEVTSELICEMAGRPSDEFMQSVWESIQSNKFAEIDQCATNLQAEGYSGAAVIRLLQEQLLVKDDPMLTDETKAKMLLHLAAMDHATEEGASEDLQFRALLSQFTRAYHKIED